MSKFTLLPVAIVIIAATLASMLTWAMARHAEIASAQRANAASRPRSRPYATSLPDSLIKR
jgi:hypothetical protein